MDALAAPALAAPSAAPILQGTSNQQEDKPFRAGLLAKLDEFALGLEKGGGAARLLVVCAPRGAGKSATLAKFLTVAPVPVVPFAFSAAPGPEDDQTEEAQYVIGLNLLTGIQWGFLGTLLFPPDPGYRQLYTIMVITCYVGGSLTVYSAIPWAHQALSREQLISRFDPLAGSDIEGGYQYVDGQVDDARLVIRVLREAVRHGGTAINYVKVEQLLRTADGRVRGVVVRDTAPGSSRTAVVQAKVVMNATGAWADELRGRDFDGRGLGVDEVPGARARHLPRVPREHGHALPDAR